MALSENMLICDTHADTLYAMQNTERDQSAALDITADRLTAGRQGDTRVQALALWTGPEGLLGKDVGLIDREMIAVTELQAQGFNQIKKISEAVPGKPNFFLTIEGGEALESGPQAVEAFAIWGVRLAAIVWNNENSFAYPAVGKNDHGLTALGQRLIKEMNKRHMGVDISHLNDAGVKDALSISKKPILASHSCCRALCDHPRNLTDDQLKAIFKMGGIKRLGLLGYVVVVLNHEVVVAQLGSLGGSRVGNRFKVGVGVARRDDDDQRLVFRDRADAEHRYDHQSGQNQSDDFFHVGFLLVFLWAYFFAQVALRMKSVRLGITVLRLYIPVTIRSNQPYYIRTV